MTKANLITASLIGLVVGIFLTIATDTWLASPNMSGASKQTTLDRCVYAADLMESTDKDQTTRYLRITDCMAANGFLFEGGKPTSGCYAENRTQITIKHILPSCYVQPSILSRLRN